MLVTKIENALNEQIIKEAYASSSYLSMASWCEIKGFRGATSFFYTQSLEEREHMLKLIQFINQAGGRSVIPLINQPPKDYNSLLDTFEISLKQEEEVSRSINELVDLTLHMKDYRTNHFLKWYVTEQHEEENLFNTILNIFQIGGFGDKNLLIIDNEIGKIRTQEKI